MSGHIFPFLIALGCTPTFADLGNANQDEAIRDLRKELNELRQLSLQLSERIQNLERQIGRCDESIDSSPRVPTAQEKAMARKIAAVTESA